MGNRDGGPFPEYPGQREQVLKDAEALVRAKFPSGIADELLKDPMLFVGHKIIPSGRGTMGYDGMIMGHSYWFIRDKEIDAVAALGTVATAIVGFTTPLAFAVPLLITLAGVLKQAADKHIEVSERDAALLLYLKHNRAQSEVEILNGLNGIRAQTSFTWNEHDLRRQLERLQKVHLADGTLEALVTQASDGRWRTNGLWTVDPRFWVTDAQSAITVDWMPSPAISDHPRWWWLTAAASVAPCVIFEDDHFPKLAQRFFPWALCLRSAYETVAKMTMETNGPRVLVDVNRHEQKTSWLSIRWLVTAAEIAWTIGWADL